MRPTRLALLLLSGLPACQGAGPTTPDLRPISPEVTISQARCGGPNYLPVYQAVITWSGPHAQGEAAWHAGFQVVRQIPANGYRPGELEPLGPFDPTDPAGQWVPVAVNEARSNCNLVPGDRVAGWAQDSWGPMHQGLTLTIRTTS